MRENTGPLDIVWANQASDGAIIALLSGRATSSAMVPENLPYDTKSDPIASARVQVWIKSTIEDVRLTMFPAMMKYNLEPVEETELAYICRNPAGGQKARTREAMIPTPWVWLALAVLTAVALLDLRVRREK